jgi:peptidoglycan/LPS O-acetylase OafA/YrhL
MGNYSLLKSLKIIWIAIILGLLFFLAVSVYLVNSGFETNLQNEKVSYYFQLLAIVILMTGLLITRFYSRKKIGSLTGNIEQKVKVFRSVFIINLAIIEGTGFFSCVGYLLFHNSNLLLLGLISVMLLLTHYPSPSRIAADLKTTVEELENQNLKDE